LEHQRTAGHRGLLAEIAHLDRVPVQREEEPRPAPDLRELPHRAVELIDGERAALEDRAGAAAQTVARRTLGRALLHLGIARQLVPGLVPDLADLEPRRAE